MEFVGIHKREQFAVRRKHHDLAGIVVADQDGRDLRGGREIPKPNRSLNQTHGQIGGDRRQPSAIRGAFGSQNGFLMVELTDLLAAFHVPKPYRLVPARRPDGLAIPQNADRRDAVGMIAENEPLLTLSLLPEIAPFPAAQIHNGQLTRLASRGGRAARRFVPQFCL